MNFILFIYKSIELKIQTYSDISRHSTVRTDNTSTPAKNNIVSHICKIFNSGFKKIGVNFNEA
jgi:hypothetical protein